jgi:hypothetical protein
MPRAWTANKKSERTSVADQIKIEIDADTRKAIAELAKLNKATESVEKEVKKLTLAQAAWKAANTDLGKITKGWQEAAEVYAKVGLAFAGVTAAGVAFAAHIDEQNRAIARLGPAYHAVTAATNGVITAQQALTLQGQIQAAGVQVNERAMAALTRQAREWADATGDDASQAIEKLTNAVVNNSEDALSEMNLAMARGTTSAQTLANMVRELEARFAGAAPPARTLTQDLEKLPQALEAIGAAALQTSQGPLETLFTGLMRIGGALAGVNVEGMNFRRTLSELANAGDDARALASGQADVRTREGRRQSRDRIIATLQRRGMRVDLSSAGGLQGLSESELTQLASAAESARSQENLDSFVSGIGSQRTQDRAAAERRAGTTNNRSMSAMEAAVERKIRKPGGSTSDPALRTARDAYNAAVAEGMAREAVLVLPDDMPRNRGETLVAYFNRLAGIQSEFNSAGAVNDLAPTNVAELENDRAKGEAAFAEDRAGTTREREQTQRRAARDRETRRGARAGSIGGRTMSALGFAMDDEGRSASFDSMAEGATLLTGTVNALTSGLTTLFDTLVTGSMDAGTAFQTFASGLLTELGKMAVQKGLFYTFEGIAALFTAPPAAPLYFAAGAGLLALGAGLGFAGAASKPATPAQGAGLGAGGTQSARGLAPRSLMAGSSGSLGNITIVNSSLVPSGPVDAQRARDGLRTVRRQGFGDRAPRRIEH